MFIPCARGHQRRSAAMPRLLASRLTAHQSLAKDNVGSFLVFTVARKNH